MFHGEIAAETCLQLHLEKLKHLFPPIVLILFYLKWGRITNTICPTLKTEHDVMILNF